MKLQTMDEVVHALAPYYEQAATMTGATITIERPLNLMRHLGNPEQKLKVVHIAGTSGKTSTTYYISSLLVAAGCKVGSTVSPHIDSLTERVQINGQPLAEEKFCEDMGEFLEAIKEVADRPSFFEVMIAFALWVFAREGVDYAVLETGMGGLLDATNVCTNFNKVCVITDIGLDHTEWLGTTHAQIAGQKAGIIHPGNVVLMYEQSEEIMQVVRFKVSQTEDADLFAQHQDLLKKAYAGAFAVGLPDYQKRNWLLAYAVYRYLANRDGIPIIAANNLVSTQQLQVPGRMDGKRVGNKQIVMDGAHNEAKMQAFVDSWQHLHGAKRVPVLLALKVGKDYEHIAPLIAQIATEIIVTTFSNNQDWPVHPQDPSLIAGELTKAGVKKVTCEPNPLKAYEQLLQTDSDMAVITGSFYLISQLRGKERELR